MNDYKRQEIKEYFNNFIKENDEAIIEDNDFYDDIHHHCFNTDYYIIGIDKAKKWLNNETLDIINIIKDYFSLLDTIIITYFYSFIIVISI